jgi:hypothetical protein
MRLTAAAPAVVLVLPLLLAGCSGDSPEPPAGDLLAACPAADVLAAGCVPWDGLEVELAGCVRSIMTLESRAVVYDLPPGYANAGTPASPQRLQLAYDRCQEAVAGNATGRDVSVGFAGVLVTAPGRGQPEGTPVYVVEALTDWPPLAEALAKAGFRAANGTVAIVDTGPLRSVRVTGDADYALDVAMEPRDGGGRLTFSTILMGDAAWVGADPSCTLYELAGAGRFTAARGELARAIPAEGALHGVSTQPISCTESLEFGALA